MGTERIIYRGFLDRITHVITSKRNFWTKHGWIFFFGHWLVFMLSLLLFYSFFFFSFFFCLSLNLMHWNFILKEHFFFQSKQVCEGELANRGFNSSTLSMLALQRNDNPFERRSLCKPCLFCPSRFSFFYPIYPSFCIASLHVLCEWYVVTVYLNMTHRWINSYFYKILWQLA